MPQGYAAVHWTDRKDVELFLAVLAVQKITVDYAAVAAVFGRASPFLSISLLWTCNCLETNLFISLLLRTQGPDVPSSCIQSRIKALRKRAKESQDAPNAPGSSDVEGDTVQDTSVPHTPEGKPAPSKRAQALTKALDDPQIPDSKPVTKKRGRPAKKVSPTKVPKPKKGKGAASTVKNEDANDKNELADINDEKSNDDGGDPNTLSGDEIMQSIEFDEEPEAESSPPPRKMIKLRGPRKPAAKAVTKPKKEVKQVEEH